MTLFFHKAFTIMLMPWPLNNEEKDELIKLGQRIKSIREQKEMSLEDVGKRAGKDRQSVHKLEKGQFNPTYIYLQALCRGLDIELSELFK